MKFRIDIFTWDDPNKAASQHDIAYFKTKKAAIEYGKAQKAENKTAFLLRKLVNDKYEVLQKI